MELTQDPASTPVLMVACVGERQVRLLEVPSFSSRGVITNVSVAASSCGRAFGGHDSKHVCTCFD
jgi:hypothetical protein